MGTLLLATRPAVGEHRLVVMEDEPPPEKPLKTTSFVIHATRGLIRDARMRRNAMFVLLVVALLLLFAGATFLGPWLNPREHLARALLFWLACLWLTMTALLLALFDLLAVRANARRVERTLREELAEEAKNKRRDAAAGK